MPRTVDRIGPDQIEPDRNGPDRRGPRRFGPGLLTAVVIAVALLSVLVTVLLTRPAGSATPTAPTTPSAQAPDSSGPTVPHGRPPATTPPAHDGMVDETALLTAARQVDGKLVITVDRVIFLFGDEATAANHGVPPENDHLIINDNPKLRTYVVDPDAELIGVTVLGDDDDATSAQVITADQLIERTGRALDHGGAPLVDVHHRSVTDATVIGVHERYVP